MPSSDDLYQVLQVAPDAEPEVIRAAYRALAQKHHPDAGGSHDRMAQLNHAWAVLSDPQSRRNYDRGRVVAVSRAAARADTAAQAAAAAPAAGAAAGRPAGTILDYGRYKGWSLADLAHHDPDYLAWLARTPAGRGYRQEIESLLAGPTRPAARPFQARTRGGLFDRVAKAG